MHHVGKLTDLVFRVTTSPEAVFVPFPISVGIGTTTWVMTEVGPCVEPRPLEKAYGSSVGLAYKELKMSSPLGQALLGASTFCAKEHGADECDGKGLPLTPHSINIVGRFRALLDLDHPGLCAYLDIRRAKNGVW